MKKETNGVTFLIALLLIVVVGMIIYMLVNNYSGIDLSQGSKQDSRYVTFLANAKKIRENYTLSDYASGSITPYRVTLDKNGNLYIEDTLLDSSVVLFYIINSANAGFEYVYYIKEDGSVYSSNTGYAVHTNQKLESEKLELNKIVTIVQGSTESSNYPIYIDIDGIPSNTSYNNIEK